MAIAGTIATIVAAAAATANAAYTISKGSPDLPKLPPPPRPPPPAPPPPATPPPPPTETAVDEAPAKAKRRRAAAFGLEQTLLASPLGSPNPGAVGTGRTLLGG